MNDSTTHLGCDDEEPRHGAAGSVHESVRRPAPIKQNKKQNKAREKSYDFAFNTNIIDLYIYILAILRSIGCPR